MFVMYGATQSNQYAIGEVMELSSPIAVWSIFSSPRASLRLDTESLRHAGSDSGGVIVIAGGAAEFVV